MTRKKRKRTKVRRNTSPRCEDRDFVWRSGPGAAHGFSRLPQFARDGRLAWFFEPDFARGFAPVFSRKLR